MAYMALRATIPRAGFDMDPSTVLFLCRAKRNARDSRNLPTQHQMKPLYDDAQVILTDDDLLLKRYYFPLGQSKKIAWTDVERVEKLPNTLWNGRWRLWGTDNLQTWFPCDWKRPCRTAIFVVHIKDRWTRAGFTVDDSAQVESILREKVVLPDDSGK